MAIFNSYVSLPEGKWEVQPNSMFFVFVEFFFKTQRVFFARNNSFVENKDYV